jgi:hypothetical protein
MMRFIRGFGQFWYDFLVGDDWKIAAAVVATLILGAVVLLTIDLPEMVLTSALGAALMAAFVIALKIDIREE